MKDIQLEQYNLKNTIIKYNEFLDDCNLKLNNLKNIYKNNYDQLLEEKFRLQNKIIITQKTIQKPYFARIDFKTNNEKDICYIGKVGLQDFDNNIITVDWRAPISSLYYDSNVGSCSYIAPKGVVNGELLLKRQYNIEDGILNSYNDVDTVVDDELLKPYLNVNCESRLKNIVSSIQEEQNKIIRESIYKNIVVQGVAGSGKTTVALHRIAYLVYNNKEIINPNQYMVLGPNKFFVNYISNILPDLDVNDVKQFDFKDLVIDYLKEDINIIDTPDNQSTYYKTSFNYKKLLDKFIIDLDKKVVPNDNLKIYDFDIMSSDHINRIYSSLNNNLNIKEKIEKTILIVEKEIETNNQLLVLKANRFIDKLFIFEKSVEKQNQLKKQRELIKKEINSNCHNILKKYFNVINKKTIEIYGDFLNNIDKYEDNKIILNYLKIDLKKLKLKQIEFEDLSSLLYLKYKINSNETYNKYKHVVIDESQDYNEFVFYTLKKIMKNSTFSIFGDLAQSIYPYRSIEDWNIINSKIMNTSILKLSKSYRTTIEIMTEANKINKYLLLDEAIPVIRHGLEVKYINNTSYEFILDKLIELKKIHKTIAVISKNEIDKDNIYDYLKNKIDITNINKNDLKYNGGICTITSSLSKGLEFDVVIINGIDEIYFNSKDKNDMKLLYVSMTRPLHELFLLYKNNITKPLEEVINESPNN